MSTMWDRAVRALRPLFAETDRRGDPLAYYCGGPIRRCEHRTCDAVSLLASDDLLQEPDLAHVQPGGGGRVVQPLALAAPAPMPAEVLAAVSILDGLDPDWIDPEERDDVAVSVRVLLAAHAARVAELDRVHACLRHESDAHAAERGRLRVAVNELRERLRHAYGPSVPAPQPAVPVGAARQADADLDGRPLQPVTETLLVQAGEQLHRAVAAHDHPARQAIADVAAWLRGQLGDPGSGWPVRAALAATASGAPAVCCGLHQPGDVDPDAWANACPVGECPGCMCAALGHMAPCHHCETSHGYRPNGDPVARCCDPNDCGPCCPSCPTCPSHTPETTR